MAVVWIPPLLRRLTDGTDKVIAQGRTLRHVLDSLEEFYPGFRDAVLDAGGDEIQPGLAVIVDGEATQLGLIQPVEEASEIHFIPAISGG
jgi:molybdopterin synthase sulfur carrier subunit